MLEIRKIAGFINRDARPDFEIPRQLIEASRAGKATAGKKSRSVIGNIEKPVFAKVGPSKAKGFITKSMETLKRDIPKLIEAELQKTFNEI